MRHDQGHGAQDRPRGPEVADILRDHAFGLPLTRLLIRVVSAIVSCRTLRLGGHREVCLTCGYKRRAYNSCRNRHCPKCQILMQELWAEAQERRLLPTHYFHVTFTVAAELRRLFRRAPEVCLNLLFEAATAEPRKRECESWDQAVQRIFGKDPLLCPACGKARMVIREVIPPMRL